MEETTIQDVKCLVILNKEGLMEEGNLEPSTDTAIAPLDKLMSVLFTKGIISKEDLDGVKQ